MHTLISLFGSSKYLTHYVRLIEKRSQLILTEEILYEKHHIVPRSLGGSNDVANIVKLTPREHYIAHRLLFHASKFSKNKQIYRKQVYSLNAFHIQNKCKKYPIVLPSRVVQQIRTLLALYKRDLTPHNKGKKHTAETRSKMSGNHFLKNGGIHPMSGKKHSEVSKKRMSQNKSKWWCKAVSPKDEILICKSTHELANLVNTNVDTISKFSNTNEPVPEPGKRYITQSTPERLNAIGWRFYRQVQPFTD
jgi:NUMOD3 motif